MFSSNTSQVAGGADPQFNYVTMLLHGDGTNGAQNNTFVDSSSNNFTITRNGNTTQGSFSPYGSLWSNYFDGSGDSLVIANNSALNFGTGDFTIEFWINTTQVSADVFNKNQNLAGSYEIYTNSSGTIYLSAGSNVPVTSTSNVCNGAWHHVVMVRSGTDLALFVDGSRQATATSTYDYTSSDSLTIGAFSTGANPFRGSLSNVRFVKGTAVYNPASSTLTVPTQPLTAITNTSLLTCQSNRFIDNSTNNFTITRNGDVSVQRFSPFAPSAAYSTATVGGSGYFDGSGDYLTVPAGSAFALSGAYTMEVWFYPTALSGFVGLLCGSQSGAIWLYLNTNGNVFFGYNGADQITTSSAPVIGQWNHIAVCRNGSNVTSVYLNGVRTGTATLSTSYSSSTGTFDVGRVSTNTNANGYFASARVVNGTAVYDPTLTTLTVPTAPLTAVTNTQLLCNFTNAGIFDNAMMNDLETVGNAQISTSVVKYGTGSLRNPANATGGGFKAVNPGMPLTGDFTLEWWAYHDNINAGSNHVMLGPWGINSSPILVRIDNGATLQIYMANGGPYVAVAVGSTGIVAATWQHYAITRSSGTCRFFVSGTQVGSSWSLSTTLNMSVVSLMCENAGVSTAADQMPGYMDDFRITNGYARYTANFAPPTQAFPNQ